jgi:hypothetical protein
MQGSGNLAWINVNEVRPLLHFQSFALYADGDGQTGSRLPDFPCEALVQSGPALADLNRQKWPEREYSPDS